MSIAVAAPTFLVAHIRRLSTAGSTLYIRIDSSDIARLGLKHGQAVEMDLGRARIAGVVKTSGGSPWLAPGQSNSNAAITAALRKAGFEHGTDVPATMRSLSRGTQSGTVVGIARRAVGRVRVPSQGRLDRIDTKAAVEAIRDYNGGCYRGRRNIDLDRDAYSRFRGGLPSVLGQLVDQIAFVGEQYGGAQDRFDDIPAEAAMIATNLHKVLGQWLKVVADAKPLRQGGPNEATLDFLFSPFTGTKQWPVWASKTLHFLRPDVFPILDSNAKKALGLRNLVNSSRGYHQFSSCFRGVLLASSEALAAARTADDHESPTDVKLLDKVLYQLGLEMD